MQLTIKDLKHKEQVIDNLEITDTVESLCEKVKLKYEFTEEIGVKLIYCGRVLDKNKQLSEYFKESGNNYVVCMQDRQKTQIQPVQPVQPTQPTQPVQPVQPVQPTQPVQPVQPTQPTQPTQSVQNQTDMYSIEQVRAALIVYTQFIHSSPELFYLSCTQPQELINIMATEMFTTTIVRPILATTNQVIDAINNNSEVNVDIAIPIRSINHSIFQQRTQAQPQQQQQVQPQQQSQVPNAPINLFDTTNNDNLSQTDLNNIEDLVSLGFPNDIAKQAYIMANKNKEMAASVLFEML